MVLFTKGSWCLFVHFPYLVINISKYLRMLLSFNENIYELLMNMSIEVDTL